MQDARSPVPTAIVVDDEPGIREFVGAVAREAGFNVGMAGSGAELLGTLNEPFPQLIVLDLNMAAMDGVQAMRGLAARRITSKIILFSGSDLRVLEAASEIARQHGLSIAAVLQKPVRRAKLLEVLLKLNRENAPFSSTTLRACIDADLVMLNYQPKIALPSGDVIGCEALLRCVDQVGRQIPAEEVVATAENGGMIDELTELVFRTALAQRQRWSQQGLDLAIALNLSARSTFNQDLPEFLVALCAEMNVPHEAVTIELTETAVMDDRLVAMEAMVRLRLKGFRLSIDDFGTGYSSLLRLKQLPFSELKIDKSFVISMHNSRDYPVIINAMIQLASNLDMRSVVEGVEDQAALDFAARMGCHEAQGYFIARPMAGDDIEGFVKSWPWRQGALRKRSGAATFGSPDEPRSCRPEA